jgi:hypothetical protein
MADLLPSSNLSLGLVADVIDISFAITQTGTISLGVGVELADELTHTLHLGLHNKSGATCPCPARP